MTNRPHLVRRIVARVRAMLPGDWIGAAGQRFKEGVKETGEKLVEKGKQYQVDERAKAICDLAWHKAQGLADKEYSESLKAFANAEEKRLDAELKRRTLDCDAREKEANARKAESEARQQAMQEIEARLRLHDTFKERGLLVTWDENGSMTVSRPGPDYDWTPAGEMLLGVDPPQHKAIEYDSNPQDQS